MEACTSSSDQYSISFLSTLGASISSIIPSLIHNVYLSLKHLKGFCICVKCTLLSDVVGSADAEIYRLRLE